MSEQHPEQFGSRGPARIARVVGGSGLVAVGVAGLVLPVVPGWLFIVPGLSLLSTELRWADDLKRHATARLRRATGRPNEEDAETGHDGSSGGSGERIA
jgi:hypothetical protein